MCHSHDTFQLYCFAIMSSCCNQNFYFRCHAHTFLAGSKVCNRLCLKCTVCTDTHIVVNAYRKSQCTGKMHDQTRGKMHDQSTGSTLTAAELCAGVCVRITECIL